jgi:hypothetical protein
MEPPSLPVAYLSAVAEMSRLFHAGELTAENFSPLRDQALAAIQNDPDAGELVEGIALFDPNPIGA